MKTLILSALMLISSYASAYDCIAGKIYKGYCLTPKTDISFKYIGESDGEAVFLANIKFTSPSSSRESQITLEFLDADGFSWHEVILTELGAGSANTFDVRTQFLIPNYAWEMCSKTKINFRNAP